MFVIASLVQFSCTDDTAAKSPDTISEKVIAGDSTGPINPVLPTKP